MTVNEYLDQAEELESIGHYTDGCSFIGFIVHRLWPELKPACWAHDYARKDLIKVDNQGENDNLFKDALKQLGAPRPLRFLMYTFTKWQGWSMDYLRMSLGAFLGFFFVFLPFVVFSAYKGGVFG